MPAAKVRPEMPLPNPPTPANASRRNSRNDERDERDGRDPSPAPSIVSGTSDSSMTRRRWLKSSVLQMLTVEVSERGACVLDPDSRAVLVWGCLVLLVNLFNAFAIPFRVAFYPVTAERGVDTLWAFGLLADVLLVADVFVTLNRGFYAQGNKVLTRNAIRRRYVSNLCSTAYPSLLRDLLSVVPLDLIELSTPHLRGALRANRLLRTPRIFSLVRELGERRVGHHVLLLIRLLLLFVLLVHAVACSWFLFGALQGFGPPRAWVPTADKVDGAGTGHRYLLSVYRALGFMTGVAATGRPSHDGEAALHVAVMVGSLLLFAYAVAPHVGDAMAYDPHGRLMKGLASKVPSPAGARSQAGNSPLTHRAADHAE